jgi:uncharacterized protein (DUF2141 family)
MKKLVCVLLLTGAGLSAGFVFSARADDTPTVTPTVTATATAVPPLIVVSLNHNRFNPLAGETVQVTGLRPDHGQVSVTVYNVAGTLVRKVADHVSAAAVAPAWDGKNAQGQVVASGVYLVVVTGNMLHKRFRIVVLK